MLSPQTTGDEWASPGTGVRHARPAFVSTFQDAGTACPSAIPLAPGPRKRGQFVTGASEARAAATSGSTEMLRCEASGSAVTIDGGTSTLSRESAERHAHTLARTG